MSETISVTNRSGACYFLHASNKWRICWRERVRSHIKWRWLRLLMVNFWCHWRGDSITHSMVITPFYSCNFAWRSPGPPWPGLITKFGSRAQWDLILQPSDSYVTPEPTELLGINGIFLSRGLHLDFFKLMLSPTW